MRKRTDAAMIEALAWLRDLGLEGGGTRCRPCARWRGRTSVRPANQGGQKIFSEELYEAAAQNYINMTSLKNRSVKLAVHLTNQSNNHSNNHSNYPTD